MEHRWELGEDCVDIRDIQGRRGLVLVRYAALQSNDTKGGALHEHSCVARVSMWVQKGKGLCSFTMHQLVEKSWERSSICDLC